MLRVLVGLSLVVLASLAGSSSASAEERVVYAGVFLHDVARLELRDGMVDVDFELWAKSFDPEAARRALAEAGASDARIELIHTSSPMDLALAASLNRSLEAVGLVIAEREVPSTHALYLEGGHGGLLSHVLRGELDAPPRRDWNLPLRQGAFARDVRHDAYDDEVDALVVREEHALFPERRDQLRERLLAEGSRRLPILPLVFAAERVLADPKLRGWDHGPGVSFGAAMERWWFEE